MLKKSEIRVAVEMADTTAKEHKLSERLAFRLMLKSLNIAEYSVEAFGIVVPQVMRQNLELEVKNFKR